MIVQKYYEVLQSECLRGYEMIYIYFLHILPCGCICCIDLCYSCEYIYFCMYIISNIKFIYAITKNKFNKNVVMNIKHIFILKKIWPLRAGGYIKIDL